MAPSFNLFRVPPDGFTYTLSGAPVTQLSYPALSFELYIPFLALGWSTQLAVGLNVAAWSASILLLFALLPRRFRAAALVLGSLTTYVAYAVGGVTDVLYVPLLIGAAYRWNRFPSERGWHKWRGPVFLGLAMSVKQEPWLLLPFVAVAVAFEADSAPWDGSTVAGGARPTSARRSPRCRTEPPVLRGGAPGVGSRRSDAVHRSCRPDRAGSHRPERFPPPGWRLAHRLQPVHHCAVRGPVGRVQRPRTRPSAPHLSDALPRVVLRGALLQQLHRVDAAGGPAGRRNVYVRRDPWGPRRQIRHETWERPSGSKWSLAPLAVGRGRRVRGVPRHLDRLHDLEPRRLPSRSSGCEPPVSWPRWGSCRCMSPTPRPGR